MEKDRKALIIKEIIYWREHQLLPAHYCDFLLALYTEGERPRAMEVDTRETPYYYLYYFFHSLLLLCPPVIFQSTQNIWLQITGNMIILIIALLMVKLYAKHRLLNDSYAVMIFLLCFLLSGMLYISNYISFWWLTYLWILSNGIVWILFGIWKNYFFVKVAGVFILIILAIAYGFYNF